MMPSQSPLQPYFGWGVEAISGHPIVFYVMSTSPWVVLDAGPLIRIGVPSRRPDPISHRNWLLRESLDQVLVNTDKIPAPVVAIVDIAHRIGIELEDGQALSPPDQVDSVKT